MADCNFCTLNRYKAKAKKEDKKLVVKRSSLGPWSQGQDVFILPHDKEVTVENRKQYFVAWLAQVPKRCEC